MRRPRLTLAMNLVKVAALLEGAESTHCVCVTTEKELHSKPGMTLFEWDEANAEINLRKHGISFVTAAKVFDDAYLLSEQDRVIDGELRWQTLGMVDGVLILLVVHTIEDEGQDEVVRIISARPAVRKERKRYGQNRQKDFG